MNTALGPKKWGYVLGVLGLAACEGHTYMTVFSDAGQERPPDLADAWSAPDEVPVSAPPDGGARYTIELSPPRQLDLVFMIDNSPSMAPKQQKLRDNFPRLISALRNPFDGSLPDLRIAIIDSDLGAGGFDGYPNCAPTYAADGTKNVYGDRGRFLMIDAQTCGVTDRSRPWLEYAKGAPVNFKGDLGAVFACLAGGLGTYGCGAEQQLEAFEWALVTPNLGNEAQRAMLRPDAQLGLVFLSDEDDCSTGMNDGMNGTISSLGGETSSLRCATRAHACGGVNLTESPPGYPTTAALAAPLTTCTAREDACPNQLDDGQTTDTSQPTSCSPVRNVKRIANSLKTLKAKPDEQIFVVGIFGWPDGDADLATASYTIAPLPNPEGGAHAAATVYGSWPVCYDPDHPPTKPDAATAYDAVAAGWGAIAGLRFASFVDEFGANGLKSSICQRDFSDSMRLFGGTLVRKMQNLCLPPSYATYASCVVNISRPVGGSDVLEPTPVPQCAADSDVRPCYALGTDAAFCPAGSIAVTLDRGSDAASPLLPDLKLVFQCR